MQSADPVVGEHPDSRLYRPARALPDVRRDDSASATSWRSWRSRSTAAYLYLNFPLPDAIRALRVLRRAVHHRADRLRLAPDSQHDNVPRDSARTARRDLRDAGGRPEEFAASGSRSAGAFCFSPARFTLVARSRGRRDGRRVAARDGRRVYGMAGRVVHAVLRIDSGSDGRTGRARSRAARPRRAEYAETGAASEPARTETSLLRTEVPFGPFLALAAGVFALFQPQTQHWYLAH